MCCVCCNFALERLRCVDVVWVCGVVEMMLWF